MRQHNSNKSASEFTGAIQYLAHQTKSDPFKLPSNGWAILDEEIKICLSKIIKDKIPRYVNGELHIRRWAIRYGKLNSDEADLLSEESIHNHSPALLTCVFYLSVPQEMENLKESKTRFFNPCGAISGLVSPSRVDIGGEQGSLIIVPGDIYHTGLSERYVSDEKSRIVVVCDIFFVSGFQDREKDDRVQTASL
tara:strand:- start:936 stop:1517 length:582 start_codon:yes stop_codon:yes gene_type:complete